MTQTVRRRPLIALTALFAAALTWMLGSPAVGSPTGRVAPATVSVIVEGTHAVETAVRRMGGVVTHDLPLIGGFSARVPAGDVDRIAHMQGVIGLAPDSPVHVSGSLNSSTNNLPSVYRHVVNADSLGAAGGNGQGVTVALLDTGVTNMPDLNGRIVRVATDPLGLVTAPCVNLTDEPTCDDSYGHGTFMAGIIAGNGAASGGQYVGAAPQAKILSVKLAGASGASDVSTIIAALQWVVSFKDVYGIRVVNLSLGTDSTQSYTIDPLDYAVERAWNAGLVVDVAASNRGPAAGTISKPADDPFVITVGAIDDMATNGTGDDELPNFTGRGPTAADGLAKPDIVAPGGHIVSLAAPGAAITTQFPSSMAAPYRRGSGTSMANAVVSGVVADMLSLQPTLTPNRIKYELMSTAKPDASTDPMAVGKGLVDGYSALFRAPLGLANQGVLPGLGTGSLAASRGSVGVVLDDANSTTLTSASGNLTQQLTTFNPATLLNDPWTGASWWTSQWTGASWWGASWWGNTWTGASWWGASWWGNPDGASWYGASWWGASWYGGWDQ